MDLSHIFTEQQLGNKSDAIPLRLVAPTPLRIPESDIVTFVKVETIKDVIHADPKAVMLFDDTQEELLSVVCEHPNVMGFNCLVLAGLPTAEYSAQFDSRTYMLERVSYASFINDLVERKRVAAALADESKTAYAKEREQYTRGNGHVKELRGTSIAGAKPLPGEPDSEEDAEASE